MFNENTLKHINSIDALISEKNKKLFDNKSYIFLSWTFPTNHQHEHQGNYFIIWVGETGNGILKSVFIGPITMITKIIEELELEQLAKILSEKAI